MEYYSVTRRKETLPLATTGMDWEDIMLGEISPTEKEEYGVVSLTRGMWGGKKSQIHRNSRKLLPGAGGGGKRQKLVEAYRYEMREV